MLTDSYFFMSVFEIQAVADVFTVNQSNQIGDLIDRLRGNAECSISVLGDNFRRPTSARDKKTETRNRAIMEILAFEKLSPTIAYYEMDLITKLLDHTPDFEASKKYANKITEIYFEMENEVIAGLGLTGSEVKQIQKLAESRAKELLTEIKRLDKCTLEKEVFFAASRIQFNQRAFMLSLQDEVLNIEKALL